MDALGLNSQHSEPPLPSDKSETVAHDTEEKQSATASAHPSHVPPVGADQRETETARRDDAGEQESKGPDKATDKTANDGLTVDKPQADADNAPSPGSERDVEVTAAARLAWKEHISKHTLIVNYVELDWEHFKHRYGENEGLHIIEALTVGPAILEEIRLDDWKGSDKRRPISRSKPTSTAATWIQRIRIQSAPILSHLCHAAGKDDKWTFDQPYTFIRPFNALAYLQPKMKIALERLEKKWNGIEISDIQDAQGQQDGTQLHGGAEASLKSQSDSRDEDTPSEDPNEEDESFPYLGMDDLSALRHMRCYVKFVDDHVMPLCGWFQGTSRRKVPFNDLPLLFRPGEIVYWLPAGSVMSVPYPLYQPVWRVFHAARTRFGGHNIDDIDLTSDDEFRVHCYYIDHDGGSYGVMKGQFTIPCFKGEKDITDLQAYPIRYADGAAELGNKLKLQGQRFQSFMKVSHAYYEGWAVPGELQEKDLDEGAESLKYSRVIQHDLDAKPSSPEHVESAVIIDVEEAFKHHPRWKPRFMVPREVDEVWHWTDDNYKIVHWSDNNRKEAFLEFKEHVLVIDGSFAQWANDHMTKDEPITASLEGRLKEVDDEDVMLLPRRLVAYALRNRKFVVVDVNSLRSLEKQPDIFKDLKIKPSNKRMVQALVKAHFDKRKMQKESPLPLPSQDIVYGKGSGLFVLLHGVPGVGKTATAEAIAQSNNKPLFSITCGNLGITPEKVEAELKEVFRLTHLWDCVLLLDEADVFLARRDITSLKRNALVSSNYMRTLYLTLAD